MNRRELVNAIAAHTGQNNKDVDATLTGFTSLRRISVAFFMCTTMESSSPDPVSMSRMLGRGGGLG